MSIRTNRLGEEKLNSQNCKMKIIKYNGCCDIDVEFENGVIRKNLTYGDFKRGCLIAVNYLDRIGEIRYNNFGSKITVINYVNSDNVYIEYDNGYKTITTWSNFNSGNIRSPYCKTFCGVGCLGEGKYIPDDIWYEYWRAMIERVTIKNDGYHRTYFNVTICDEWYNYQIFAEWAENNYYEIPNYKMQLDKDILIKGNKIYSPFNCVFVPDAVNSLFVKADKTRGNYPIGVYWHERDQEYRSQCSYINDKGIIKNQWLGGYNTPEEAFEAYKSFKEDNIKKTADRFKDYIPQKLYNALYNYIVEITD